MKTTVQTLLFLALLNLTSLALADGVVAPGAKLEKLPATPSPSPKAPPATAAGNVFFTDQPNDRIMK